MKRHAWMISIVALGIALLSTDARADVLEWSRLPSIPDNEGFAGSFAGVAGGALVVAGGANFPGPKPWEGGTKVWHDAAFVLQRPDGAWRRVGKLPRPLAYGVSITTPRGIACIGGGDAARHYAAGFLVEYRDGMLTTSPLPPLPKACAFACGAMLGTTIYVAGGIENPSDTAAMRNFWSLDLSQPAPQWVELDAWPGEPRMLATAGALDGSFFLFSGTALEPGPDGKPARKMLRDAYRFTPGRGWRRLADLPRVALAAPTPAPAVGATQLLVLGGEDGAQAHLPLQEHRGFPRGVLAYDVTTDTWSKSGEVPFSLVTTPVVLWHERVVVPGGESRPGFRSVEVWAADARMK
jgi:N-acetylneuraminic acid mutarotase